MFKTNKNSIIFSLAILSIMSFIVMFKANTANAQYNYSYPIDNPTPMITSLTKASTNGNVIIAGFGFIPTSIVRVNGSDHSAKFIDDQHFLINLNQNDIAQGDPLYISVFNAGIGGGYSNAYSIKSSEIYTTHINTNNNYNSSNSTYNRNDNTNNNSNNNTNQNNTNETTSSLASNAIYGSAGSLVPSGLIGWILFAILVLLIIMIVRRLFGFTEAYHSTPLKHD